MIKGWWQSHLSDRSSNVNWHSSSSIVNKSHWTRSVFIVNSFKRGEVLYVGRFKYYVVQNWGYSFLSWLLFQLTCNTEESLCEKRSDHVRWTDFTIFFSNINSAKWTRDDKVRFLSSVCMSVYVSFCQNYLEGFDKMLYWRSTLKVLGRISLTNLYHAPDIMWPQLKFWNKVF
jgi:hypothetical protein